MENKYYYEYKGDSKYCYENSNVLKNKVGIKDNETLSMVEREVTAHRYAELQSKGITGNFDLKHLQQIHAFLFQDIYEWAGDIRTVDISKGVQFCLCQYIKTEFDKIYSQLKDDNFLIGISDKHTIVQKLSYYLSEINAIHPFREGNGRTQRIFCEQLCLNTPYLLNFSNATEQEMLEASYNSFYGKYELMEKLIEKCLE